MQQNAVMAMIAAVNVRIIVKKFGKFFLNEKIKQDLLAIKYFICIFIIIR